LIRAPEARQVEPITGAARDIGVAVGRACIREGARVVLAGLV